MMKPSGDRDDPAGGSSKPKKKEKPTRVVHVIHYNYPVEKVFALRQTLKEAVGLEFLGKTPRGESFRRLVELVQEVLPGGIEFKTLEDSLRHLAGTRIDERLLDAVCWRMAGNTKRLRQRRAVPPWHVQKLPEWVPAQIVSCRRERTSAGKVGARFVVRILAGTPAGLTAEKFYPLKFCRYISQEFGFTRPRGDRHVAFPYAAPEQFVGMRLYVCVEPALSGKEPGFDGLGFPPSLSKWNKTTLKCRFRVQPEFRCQMEVLPADLPCHNCPVGFLKCRAGTHRQDWVERECRECNREDAFFDPESNSELCVDCTIRAAYKSDR